MNLLTESIELLQKEIECAEDAGDSTKDLGRLMRNLLQLQVKERETAEFHAPRVPPWQKRRTRVLAAFQSKLADGCGIGVQDPLVTVNFTDPESGQHMTVSMVVTDTDVYIPAPECPKSEKAAAKKRRRQVRQERVTDKWASPSGPGGWLCPDSPTGYCWYDDEVDPIHDHCLSCGHPKERK